MCVLCIMHFNILCYVFRFTGRKVYVVNAWTLNKMFYHLKYFGVIFFDSCNDNNVCQIVYSVILFITGIIMMIISPYIAFRNDHWSKVFFTSTTLTLLMSYAVNISSLISRMIVIYDVKYKYQKYKTTLEGFEIYIPTDAIASKLIKYFSFAVIFSSMSIIIPVNGLRLYHIFNNSANPVLMTTYFCFYYIHNVNMVCTELHFAVQCFVVYTKFRDINEKLIQINDEQNYYCNYNVRYPFTASRVATARGNDDTSSSSSPCVIVYEKDFYCSKDKIISPLANTVELLRIKHWLTREAVNDLKGLFGFRMGLSIICIVTTTLFDVYSVVFYSGVRSEFNKPEFRTNLIFAGLMLQYSLRFCIIVITAHTATKQVNRVCLCEP